MAEIILHYTVQSEPALVTERAEALLLEQTVELSRPVVTDDWVKQNILGRILHIREAGRNLYEVVIAQPLRTTALDPAQLLNVAFGNSSLQPDVALSDIEPSPELAAAFPGPRFGIAGIRQAIGVPRRALTSTALKPMGLSPEAMAKLAYDFAVAGIDLIKDDHGLADHDFCPFAERVARGQAAVDRANRETGGTTLYIPNLIGGPDAIYRQLDLAKRAGIGAVMISPLLVGPALLAELAGKAGVPILAHPSFGGITRVSPEALFGRIFKWFGADAVIYPHQGGRFSYSRETCKRLVDTLRALEHGLKPAFPVPAGGIKTARVREILEFYGPDTVLLVGGSLLEDGDIVHNTKTFVAEAAKVSEELVR
jgi:ribulose-bisphosphate carboxylase large chain